MMGFSPMGSGAGANSSSSTSNLSALAPPFTVDRSNPKLNSNPNLPYHDSPYTAEPYSHGWEYSIPSAPIVLESTGLASVPLPDDHRFSAATTVSPTITHWSTFSRVDKASTSASYGDVKPYYSPYVPRLVGDESPLVEVDVTCYNKGPTSQIDYTRGVWDVDYEAGWAGNLGLNDGKRANRVEIEGSFFEKSNIGDLQSYGHQLNQGWLDTEKNEKVSKEGSYGISNQIFNQVPDTGIHCGNSVVTQTKDNLCHEQNLGFFPYDSNKSLTSAYKSTYRESQELAVHKNSLDDQNSSTKCRKTVDKPFIGHVSSNMRSSAGVIRLPPANNGYIKQCTFARKSTQCDSDESVRIANFGSISDSQLKEGSSETSLFGISNEGNFLTPLKELSIPLQSSDSLDRTCRAGFGSQSHDESIYGGFNMAGGNSVQTVKSNENSLDFVVDSPCWKGTSCSQFSTFDIEAGNSNNFKKKLDGYYESNHEAQQKNLDSVIDIDRTFFGKASESNSNIGKNESDTHCSSKDNSLLGDGKCRGWVAKENETLNEPNMPRKQSVLAKDLAGEFDAKTPDAKHLIDKVAKTISLNDVTEGGFVAVHAAEKVLASPASQEDANERIKETDWKLHVPTVLKAMHNLSELLMFHLSGESCSLEKENIETLENTISNLNSCLHSKITEASKKPKLNNPVRNSSGKLLESRNMHTLEHEGNNSYFGKKDEKSPILSPLMDGIDMSSDDSMTKAIKKVLEENFLLNEEIHSEALLFKNLWLDAEAKLCSISYKARFDRMKIQMEQIRIKGSQDNEDCEGISSDEVSISPADITASEVGPKGPHDDQIVPKPALQDIPASSTGGPTDDVDASVLARFNILKSREENAKPNKGFSGEQNEDPIVASLKLREENFGKLMGMEEYENQPRSSEMNDACENTSLHEFHHSVTNNDPTVHSCRNNLGRRDSSSSDWEHVLKDDFSCRTCVNVVSIVKEEVTSEYNNKDQFIASALLRLHFHDCFVRGCDGSILLDSTPGKLAEKDAPPNNPSLRKKAFALIDRIKGRLESLCPGVVSCADILAFAARESVLLAGGPVYYLEGGRNDGRISNATEATQNLPKPQSNYKTLTEAFNGTADPSLNKSSADFLRGYCKRVPQPLVNMDDTPNAFDTKYYEYVLEGKVVLSSDNALLNNKDSRSRVKQYNESSNKWFQDFAKAMEKMAKLSDTDPNNPDNEDCEGISSDEVSISPADITASEVGPEGPHDDQIIPKPAMVPFVSINNEDCEGISSDEVSISPADITASEVDPKGPHDDQIVPKPAFEDITSSRALQKDYYKNKCFGHGKQYNVEALVSDEVKSAYRSDKSIAPALLRLHFHDCFVRGCDASILLDSTRGKPAEKVAPPNNPSIKQSTLDRINYIKGQLESLCKGVVSCADIIAFAARDSVVLTGGKSYEVLGGRMDGRISNASEAKSMVPSPQSNYKTLSDAFKKKNLTEVHMIALSGAHTIGQTNCSSVTKRPAPASCSRNPQKLVDMENTPQKFDNGYYNRVLQRQALFSSDNALLNNKISQTIVKRYNGSFDQWFHDFAIAMQKMGEILDTDKSNHGEIRSDCRKFAEAMVKMGSIEVLTGSQGEVRANCRVINGDCHEESSGKDILRMCAVDEDNLGMLPAARKGRR
ncbi:peroxidase [Striga asiatica]|uniref:peroxidase n=1 Tax=Striga asiatica TaxID=4170 RepID=A0A5A7QS49_STRAF|nr:peroxidase [Striga asiatica]